MQRFWTLCVAVAAASIHSSVQARSCSDLSIQHQADIGSICPRPTMTMRQDVQGRPYLYVAQKTAGLQIYDISNLAAPSLIDSIPVQLLDSLQVMNLSQLGTDLYLALGNHFSDSQSPGMAIVDVSDPTSPSVTDVYRFSAPDGGGGIVEVEDSYAYLGAMKHGLIILDVTNKRNIAYVSQFVPDIQFPDPNPNPNFYNARGMVVKNGRVYLCYDAGGLRIIDTTNKSNPVEIGRYSNPVMNGKPRAYNNIVLDGALAYIAVDYCGLEVLNVSDPSHISQVSWWNPWHCETNPFNWFSSPGHANEIEYNRNCKLLFISTGKSDLHVVDIANPAAPDSCASWGGVANNIGTWGVDLYQDRIFLSYVCAIIPFASNWTGVKALTYTACPSAVAPMPWDRVKRLYR